MNFTLIPIDFDTNESEALNNAIEVFNESQAEFSITKIDAESYTDEALIEWSDIQADLTARITHDRLIGVTSKPFADNWFSHTEGKISVISISDWLDFYAPPGVPCYLLMEFALAAYFHSSNVSENQSQPHNETIGCLLDLCMNKPETRWKLRVGDLCAGHRELFINYGGPESKLIAIQLLLESVRLVSLGQVRNRAKEQQGAVSTEFTIDSLRRHPLVVAGVLFLAGAGLAWTTIWNVKVDPQQQQIKELNGMIRTLEKLSTTPNTTYPNNNNRNTNSSVPESSSAPSPDQP